MTGIRASSDSPRKILNKDDSDSEVSDDEDEEEAEEEEREEEVAEGEEREEVDAEGEVAVQVELNEAEVVRRRPGAPAILDDFSMGVMTRIIHSMFANSEVVSLVCSYRVDWNCQQNNIEKNTRNSQ